MTPGRIIDGELAELTAQRNEQNRIIAELQASNAALDALYADALVTIAQLRAEYQPRSAPGAQPTPLADVTDLAVLKDVAVRKIVALQVDLAEQKRRAEAAEALLPFAVPDRRGIDLYKLGCSLIEREAKYGQELANRDAMLQRMDVLLTGVANALKGPPAELVMHDWSDLPELAAEVSAVIAAAIKARQCYCGAVDCPALGDLDAEMAKVDARRGGGR